MLITILLPTINRTDQSLEAIQSIYAQTFENFEIIVLDQSKEVVNAYDNFDNRLRYVHLKEAGLTHARNIGISLARGTIIGILDDDARYNKTCLEVVSKNFDNKTALLTGAVRDPVTGEALLRGMSDKPQRVGYKNSLTCCISTGMFFATSYLKQHPFDQRFGVGRRWGSGEETDLVLSIIDSGMDVRYLPTILVYHEAATKNTIKSEKIKAYALGFGAVLAKHTFGSNKVRALSLFIYILIRQIGGVALYSMRGNTAMSKYYGLSFRYQMLGFREFVRSSRSLDEGEYGKK